MNRSTSKRDQVCWAGAFTLIELLVVIAIIAVLASLTIPTINGSLVKGQITQTMSNYRQLWLASQIAANDSVARGESNSGFPGDCGSFANWSNALVPAYLDQQSFKNLLSVKGSEANTLVCDVSFFSPDSDVMLTTANITGTSNSISVGNVPPFNLWGGGSCHPSWRGQNDLGCLCDIHN